MKRPIALASLLVALAVCLAAFAPVALADDIELRQDEQQPDAELQAAITWTPPGLTIPLAPGESYHARVHFTSEVAIPHASLLVSFPLSRYVRVHPSAPFPVVPGPTYPVELDITMPEENAPHMIMGMVQVVGLNRVYPHALFVTLLRTNVRPPIQWTPPEVRLELEPAASVEPAPSAASAVVTFTSSITIANARLRATAPLNHLLDLSLTGPMEITPGVTYTLQLTAHLPSPTATTAADIQPGPARRVVSGLVQISDQERVYPRSLFVNVVIGPAPQPPAIHWRPPVVIMHLELGHEMSRVVTMTSNITIENAHLKLTGDITPYLTLAPSAPFTVLPGVPYPVTLAAAPPMPPVPTRPKLGEVVVIGGDGRVYRHALKVTLIWRRPLTSATDAGQAMP